MPRTFYQHICARRNLKKIGLLNDKISVRRYLRKITKQLPKTYYTGNVRKCNFKKLPANYVVKSRTGYAGRNVKIVRNNNVNAKQLKRFFIKKKMNIIVEELLTKNKKKVDIDYKFFVFGGKVKTIVVVTNINTKKHTQYDYTPNWKRLIIHTAHPTPIHKQLPKPKNLNQMIKFAEKLGRYYHKFTGIPFVRVDLYDTDKGIIFGEYTGGPNGGKHIMKRYQHIFGKYWQTATKNLKKNKKKKT